MIEIVHSFYLDLYCVFACGLHDIPSQPDARLLLNTWQSAPGVVEGEGNG